MKKSIVTVLMLATAVLSFDGQRKGFTLGGGAGGSFTTYKPELSFDGSTMEFDRESSGGFATNLVIGYGISNTLLLHYFSHTNWFSYDNGDGDVTVATGNAGVQLVKYLVDGDASFVPSPYLYGGLGWSGWQAPFEGDDYGTLVGLGVSAGAGYEFAKHWSVQGGVFFTNPSDEEDGLKLTYKTVGFHVQIVGLAY
ncbi:MAG: hypothetical protein K0Q91_1775 [Fibrobacteria bacterium]|jgi:hypothetical protein|nr:hypothetical protein [Fibrobacteria bacterium]